MDVWAEGKQAKVNASDARIREDSREGSVILLVQNDRQAPGILVVPDTSGGPPWIPSYDVLRGRTIEDESSIASLEIDTTGMPKGLIAFRIGAFIEQVNKALAAKTKSVALIMDIASEWGYIEK